MQDRPRQTAAVIIEPVSDRPSVKSVVQAFASERHPAILETGQRDRFSRFSVFACDPAEIVEWRRGSPLDELPQKIGGPAAFLPADSPIPFAGGWIGFLSYEAGVDGDAASGRAQDSRLPLARFGLYDAAAVYDHGAGQWYATAVEWPLGVHRRRAGARDRIDRIRRLLADAASTDDLDLPTPSAAAPVVADLSRAAYGERFKRIQHYIAAGDVYQVNLTMRFRAETSASPLELYLRLREFSPAPYAALLRWGDSAVISSSPELFLSLRSGRVVTRPIKGTRPRSPDAMMDEIYRRDLAGSDKERAELNMIVDLLRNDIGRVCAYGAVRVAHDGEIEAHSNVLHRVATIEGRLRAGYTWADLLRATFPGGSITGAPKIRAMQIISELEPVPRGVYCGAIGWIGLNGDMSMSIAIRTMIQHGRSVHLHAGSGIVADSDLEQEYEETMTKLAGMKQALYGSQAGVQPTTIAKAAV